MQAEKEISRLLARKPSQRRYPQVPSEKSTAHAMPTGNFNTCSLRCKYEHNVCALQSQLIVHLLPSLENYQPIQAQKLLYGTLTLIQGFFQALWEPPSLILTQEPRKVLVDMH